MTDIWGRVLGSRDEDDGRPVYERIADTIAASIQNGELAPGVRLPTVRELSVRLNVSSTTVMSVYNRLGELGMVRGETGRGTFVNSLPGGTRRTSQFTVDKVEPAAWGSPAHRQAWRRRLLAQSEARLRAMFPDATDLMRGSPDHTLFPLTAIKQAFRKAASATTARSLEYPSQLDVDPALVEPVLDVLRQDGVDATAEQLLVMNSSQQFLQLIAQFLVERSNGAAPVIAVEEPGYQTAMDTFERAGCVLVGVRTDQEGAVPSALAAALEHDVSAVLFTPRAHSPTGARWTAERREQLANVLAGHRNVTIVEDDHFAEAAAAPVGTLRSDPRIREQVLYVRSFAKSIAPDLRLAVGVADAGIRVPLGVQKSFADGWTSHISQRALGALLSDGEVAKAMRHAARVYAERRATAVTILADRLSATGVVLPDPDAIDGLHIWLALPPGSSADQVVQDAARHGYLVASGEPFFLQPGNDSFVRLNAGAVDLDAVTAASTVLAESVERAVRAPATALMTP